ncbi:MAG: FkbM family methyltransferase [Holosporaceae bacterium]|nr:FkbM family methyltransferase [Holosporaceae bacterium]
MASNFRDEELSRTGFFGRNKIVLIAVIIACVLFAAAFFMERSKSVVDIIPVLRGEISLQNGFAITTTREQYPILIKKDDPIVGSKLRFSGDPRSLFAETAAFLVESGDIVVEVGAHFGYNAVRIGNKLGRHGKYYAFEPNDGIAAYFRKSIMLNDLEDIVVLKTVAVSNTEETISIDDYLSISKNPDGSFTKPRSITADCSTLDIELAGELRPVSLLLADIPGLEFDIIGGAKKLIDNSDKIKIIISLNKEIASTRYHAGRELKKMQERGFRIYMAEGFHRCKEADIDEIISQKEAVVILSKQRLSFTVPQEEKSKKTDSKRKPAPKEKKHKSKK